MKGGADTRKRGERLRHLEDGALRCFARAAALMTDPSQANKGEALFWGALGVLRIAESDPELEALARAEEVLAYHRRDDHEPGPELPVSPVKQG